jgi:hypothetical protein
VDHIRASSHNGCIQRPNTWLHPNDSRRRQILFPCTAGRDAQRHIFYDGVVRSDARTKGEPMRRRKFITLVGVAAPMLLAELNPSAERI